MVGRHRRRLQIFLAGRGHQARARGGRHAFRRTDPGEKLAEVQKLLAGGWDAAAAIFRSIGVYLGHTLALYAKFYDIRHLLVLGRVVSGEGGRLIVAACESVLAEEYPALKERVQIVLPDEASRRVGQSVAAASLPATD